MSITHPDQVHDWFTKAVDDEDVDGLLALYDTDGTAVELDGSETWAAEIVRPDGTVVTQRGVTAEVSVRQPDGTWLPVIDDPMFV